MAYDPSPLTLSASPTILLLGGAPGTGKTTISNVLVNQLGLSHHISTGFIRSSIAHLVTEKDAVLLGKHSYDAYQALADPISSDRTPLMEGATRQLALLKPSIQSCINRSVREGIGMILEGSHFIPGILEAEDLGATLLCVMDVPDREELKRRALGPNHTRRRLTREQLGRLIQLQDEILALARAHCQPVINNNNLSEAVCQIRALVGT